MLSDSFYLTGAVSNKSALFTYDSKYLLGTYYNAGHDASFIPVFTVPDNPEDPLANETSKICSGEGAQFCRYEKNTYRHNSKQRIALWEMSDKKETSCLFSVGMISW